MQTKQESELSLAFFEESLAFWKPLGIKIIILSQKPEFPFFKETLEKGGYPNPSLVFSDMSLRKELRDFLASENVHLVNAKEIFCNITGNCDFKLGPKNQFKASDFLFFDGHHLTERGQKEFSRILLETDPVFKQIAEGAKK